MTVHKRHFLRNLKDEGNHVDGSVVLALILLYIVHI
jgi:hypothetical protein